MSFIGPAVAAAGILESSGIFGASSQEKVHKEAEAAGATQGQGNVDTAAQQILNAMGYYAPNLTDIDTYVVAVMRQHMYKGFAIPNSQPKVYGTSPNSQYNAWTCAQGNPLYVQSWAQQAVQNLITDGKAIPIPNAGGNSVATQAASSTPATVSTTALTPVTDTLPTLTSAQLLLLGGGLAVLFFMLRR